MKKYALVIGLGISGKGALRLLSFLGYRVIGYDDKGGAKGVEIPVVSRGELLPDLPFDLSILSPGIPMTHPVAITMREKGVEVIGEAELAFRHLSNRSIGITGTNGKTTLTHLLAYLLNKGGIKAAPLGNVGTSLASYAVDADREEVVVAELSSFQLETLYTPRFECGVITSITPDHLDRYPSFEAYAQAKCHLSFLIRRGGILYAPKEVIKRYGQHFSRDIKVEEISPLQLTSKERYWGKLDEKKSTFIAAIAHRFGLDESKITEHMRGFPSLPHRLEYVGEVDGIAFYNDSKATNVEAVLFAVRTLKQEMILIAGGLDKGSSFTEWKASFKGKVRSVVTIGKAAPLIEEALGNAFPIKRASTLEKAFAHAYKIAKKGEAIVLSPGCASFDQFVSYEERGESFKRLFSDLRRRR